MLLLLKQGWMIVGKITRNWEKSWKFKVPKLILLNILNQSNFADNSSKSNARMTREVTLLKTNLKELKLETDKCKLCQDDLEVCKVRKSSKYFMFDWLFWHMLIISSLVKIYWWGSCRDKKISFTSKIFAQKMLWFECFNI